MRTADNTFTRAALERIERVACVVRRVIGVPDYDRYVAHMRSHHPDAVLPTQEEFIRQRQVDRYSKPGARCC
ncbi:MAG: YbdD/YjiX family protein [Gemmatimonadaceae bacterium]